VRLIAANLSLAILLCPSALHAAQIEAVALTHGKATLVIDAARPRTLSSGQVSPEGVRLISANPDGAVIEFEGKRRTLTLGTSYRAAAASSSTSAVGSRVVLSADTQGHFVVTGMINNAASVRFLVDTGASLVSISAEDARRAGINYMAGRPGRTRTASGVAPVYQVKLDTLKVGEIVLYNVDAAVHTSGQLPIALLGMSFLNRMDMKRDGVSLTLTRRY
jgi:aspartyl protease family protein